LSLPKYNVPQLHISLVLEPLPLLRLRWEHFLCLSVPELFLCLLCCPPAACQSQILPEGLVQRLCPSRDPLSTKTWPMPTLQQLWVYCSLSRQFPLVAYMYSLLRVSLNLKASLHLLFEYANHPSALPIEMLPSSRNQVNSIPFLPAYLKTLSKSQAPPPA
jgi:hypothetical protein